MAMTHTPCGEPKSQRGALATAIALAGIALLSAPFLPGDRPAAALLAQDSELRPIVKPQAEPAEPAGGAEGEATEETADEPLDAALDELGPGDLTGGLGAMDEITRLTREIRENMKKIEELLNRRETGAPTQGAQSRTIEQIDTLIDLVESACSSSSSGGGSQGKGAQSSSTQEQDQRRSGRKQEGISSEQRSRSERRPEPTGKTPEESPVQGRNDQTSEGELPPEEAGDLREQEGRGRWGRLPRTEIEKMYDNGRRQLPEKYRILLEDYFRRLPTDGE